MKKLHLEKYMQKMTIIESSTFLSLRLKRWTVLQAILSVLCHKGGNVEWLQIDLLSRKQLIDF